MLRMWTSSLRIKSIPPALRSNLANRPCLRRSTNRTPHDYALPCTIPKYCCVVVSFFRKHYGCGFDGSKSGDVRTGIRRLVLAPDLDSGFRQVKSSEERPTSASS